MAAILIMVGQGMEEPSVIGALLNVEQNPGKPQYQMASEIPLLLHRTGFDRDLNFICSSTAAAPILHTIACQKNDLLERLALVSAIEARVKEICPHLDPSLLQGRVPHIPLMKRGTDPTFAERLLAHQQKKGQVVDVVTGSPNP